MKWILILWVAGVPTSTGVMTQPDEATCQRTLVIWETIDEANQGVCRYGNLKELNLEQYQEDSNSN